MYTARRPPVREIILSRNLVGEPQEGQASPRRTGGGERNEPVADPEEQQIRADLPSTYREHWTREMIHYVIRNRD